MAILKKEELINKLSAYIGEDNSDAAIEILEDVSDTIDAGSDADELIKEVEELKIKVEETDKEWREKYKARFLEGSEDPAEPGEEETEEEEEIEEKTTYDELFEEEKEDD